MKTRNKILVCSEAFDAATEYRALQGGACSDGACAIFVGSVRDFNDGNDIRGLALEHYPGMTEKSLDGIVADARARWPLGRVSLLHRVGSMQINDEIVFVGVTSPHRQAAFAACQYIMDRLKTEAPFWKRETIHSDGVTKERWVEARDSDREAAGSWA
nr:molybdopterin synthase catalytic subunit MoaE [Microbulbifer hainanensis]